MINTHEQDKKQFVRLFQEQGLDRFDERFQVLDAFLQLDHHVTQSEIVRQLEKNGKHLPDEFVFSSMEHLCRFGFATKVEFDQGETLYEHRHIGIHHDHMICTKCGTILEFKDEALERQQKKSPRPMDSICSSTAWKCMGFAQHVWPRDNPWFLYTKPSRESGCL